MIFKLIIGILLLATVLYYIFCFLEIFGVIKFTKKETNIKIGKMLIPFFYLFFGCTPEMDHPITVSVEEFNVHYYEAVYTFDLSDMSEHGWTIDCPEWVESDDVSGVGSKTIEMTFQENWSNESRQGTIVITDKKTKEIVVIPVLQKHPRCGVGGITIEPYIWGGEWEW